MGLFNIDIGLVLWTWIVFGILYFILQRYAFPGILGAIKNREDKIALSVNKALEIEKRLSDMENEKNDMIKEAKAQASEILRQVRLHSDKLSKERMNKAEEDAREMIAQAKIKMDEERNALIKSIRADIADFVCDTSEKVVERSFVDNEDRSWVKELVEKI